ncbi:hypothetical protein Y1Q_0016772 [Alligator mississippiensis]|uniref:Uncharacterized protein n=1 Tax=Alligator mississippiensis TaxID=8496 RepID=A0A151P600_ALLMI|nr:hypothetical protein Y1Q_0016772 [Alligator mississippiensis]
MVPRRAFKCAEDWTSKINGLIMKDKRANGYFIKRRGPLRGTLSPGEELQYKERRNRGHPQIILPLTLRKATR